MRTDCNLYRNTGRGCECAGLRVMTCKEFPAKKCRFYKFGGKGIEAFFVPQGGLDMDKDELFESGEDILPEEGEEVVL